MKLEFFKKIFEKNFEISNLKKNPLSESRIIQRGRRTDTTLPVVVLRNFSNAPKNSFCPLSKAGGKMTKTNGWTQFRCS